MSSCLTYDPICHGCSLSNAFLRGINFSPLLIARESFVDKCIFVMSFKRIDYHIIYGHWSDSLVPL